MGFCRRIAVDERIRAIGACHRQTRSIVASDARFEAILGARRRASRSDSTNPSEIAPDAISGRTLLHPLSSGHRPDPIEATGTCTSHRTIDFEVDDPVALLAELAAVGPATLVTIGTNGLRASILPMLFDPKAAPTGRCEATSRDPTRSGATSRTTSRATSGPMSPPRSNPSPSSMARMRTSRRPGTRRSRPTGKVVPTWNYVTVLAHGSITVHREPEWLLAHVRQLTDRHEAGRPDPWSIDDTPDGYVETQVKAIVGLNFGSRVSRPNAS